MIRLSSLLTSNTNPNTIIGGYLSSTNEVTNKVSTFNEDNQTWISYYPDMLLARRQPVT